VLDHNDDLDHHSPANMTYPAVPSIPALIQPSGCAGPCPDSRQSSYVDVRVSGVANDINGIGSVFNGTWRLARLSTSQWKINISSACSPYVWLFAPALGKQILVETSYVNGVGCGSAGTGGGNKGTNNFNVGGVGVLETLVTDLSGNNAFAGAVFEVLGWGPCI
jgi:hypothetical protein